jgi:hypothetical protein
MVSKKTCAKRTASCELLNVLLSSKSLCALFTELKTIARVTAAMTKKLAAK